MLEMFYREFISLKFLKAKKERVNHKIFVMNNASNLCNYELTPECPSNMYKALNETTGSEETKAQVNTIENRLTSLMKIIKVSLQVIHKKLKAEISC